MEIKTKLVASFIDDNVFILLIVVLFVSASSITGSTEGVKYFSTQLWVMAPDYIVSNMIINTDTCLLSISGTCRTGSKDWLLTTIYYAKHDNRPPEVSLKINTVMKYSVLL